jgi:hypothetical protein
VEADALNQIIVSIMPFIYVFGISTVSILGTRFSKKPDGYRCILLAVLPSSICFLWGFVLMDLMVNIFNNIFLYVVILVSLYIAVFLIVRYNVPICDGTYRFFKSHNIGPFIGKIKYDEKIQEYFGYNYNGRNMASFAMPEYVRRVQSLLILSMSFHLVINILLLIIWM